MVRSYDPERRVPDEVVDHVVSAALRAPSAGDTQGTTFLVLSDPTDVAAFWSATSPDGPADRWLSGMRTAPVLILVWTSVESYQDRYARPDKGWTDRDLARWSAPYWFVDAGMASMAALLAVVDAQLGACFFGVPPDRVAAVRHQFGVPDEQLSVGVISVGYLTIPAESGVRRRSPRRPRSERVHRGRWTAGYR
jgi:nitroreductase